MPRNLTVYVQFCFSVVDWFALEYPSSLLALANSLLIFGMVSPVGALADKVNCQDGDFGNANVCGSVGNQNNSICYNCAVVPSTTPLPPFQELSQFSKPKPSRSFFIGQWQVHQVFGQVSGGTLIDYLENGRFIGEQTTFIGGIVQKVHISGVWVFQRLSDETFYLELYFDTGRRWQGRFKIIDQNRIHNIDQNYVAIRTR